MTKIPYYAHQIETKKCIGLYDTIVLFYWSTCKQEKPLVEIKKKQL